MQRILASSVVTVPGAMINGRQNLGENIGDLGGLSVAYTAYRRYVDEKQGGKAPVSGEYNAKGLAEAIRFQLPR
jgi:predicted metalloendopeptidase